MRHIYTSIDIGTDTIKIAVCEYIGSKINLLATSSSKSKGIKKGLIVDAGLASESLRKGIEEIETTLGIKLDKVIASVPSYFADFKLVKGEVLINSEDKIVTGDDIVDVLQCGLTKLEPNTEMVTIMPIDFVIDDMQTVKDPKGMKASKLCSRAILVTTPTKNIVSVLSLLEKNGLEVVDISINGIGDMYSLKSHDFENKVGAIINVGSETTSISLYNKGIIVKNSIIGLGGKSIDNDISYMYKVSMDEARKVKEKFGLAHKKYASMNDLYDMTLSDGSIVKVNQLEISEIIMARLEEILTLSKKEIKCLTNKPVEYIIITGGTSNMAHLEYLNADIFGEVAKIARINLVGIRNNKYTSCLGNIVYHISKQKLKGQLDTMISTEDQDDLSSVKKSAINISNESMLGKVVGYFFGE